jgi:hypothetical protein
VQLEQRAGLPVIVPVHTSRAEQQPTRGMMETTHLRGINLICWLELTPAVNVVLETMDIAATGTLATRFNLENSLL